MCNAVTYQNATVAFARPGAELPILTRAGDVKWVPWGVQYGTKNDKRLPEGACARLESVRAGRWRRWSPVPVKIPGEQFSERGADRCNYWFWIPEGMVLQGLLVPPASDEDTPRVYVVTVDLSAARALLQAVSPTPPLEQVHDRWPRFVARHATGQG